MANILAIDDEKSILELVKNGLQKDGHIVSGFTSAEQVSLDKLNRYDLIILDIMMPDIENRIFGRNKRLWYSFSRVLPLSITAQRIAAWKYRHDTCLGSSALFYDGFRRAYAQRKILFLEQASQTFNQSLLFFMRVENIIFVDRKHGFGDFFF